MPDRDRSSIETRQLASTGLRRSAHPLQLPRIGLPSELGHLQRGLRHLARSTHARVDEPGADRVDARKIAPLNREALAEVDHRRLRRVIGGLSQTVSARRRDARALLPG